MLMRDQERALHAYGCVEAVQKEARRDYKIAVNDLGANIMRGGLCAALAAVQRRGEGSKLLLEHLAGASVPGLEDANAHDLPRRVSELNTEAYMVATREILLVAVWLKRAAQATFGD
jgi:CRISPR-associated protein Cmr5